LGSLSFGNRVIVPPAGLSHYTTTVDLRPATNLLVRIDAGLDPATSVLSWRFISLDPRTGGPPEDALAGFLPPNRIPPEGDGNVIFTASSKKDVITGTSIRNKASVVFDTNAPILTPEWSNTLDTSKPASQVLALASQQTTSSFAVSWQGSDVGAGVRDYSIYVSDNGGQYDAWLTDTSAIQATYSGAAGHTYRFYSIARDLVGNTEAPKSTAEATTTITTPPMIQCTGCYFLIGGVRATLAFNIAAVGSASTFSYNYRTSTQTVQFVSSTTSQIAVNGTTATFSGQGKLNGVAGYNFAVTAKDGGPVGSGLDTVSITMTGPSNYSYSASSTITGGDIVVKQ
jgi:hypothetical protein